MERGLNDEVPPLADRFDPSRELVEPPLAFVLPIANDVRPEPFEDRRLFGCLGVLHIHSASEVSAYASGIEDFGLPW
jgi:hypothetical protein